MDLGESVRITKKEYLSLRMDAKLMRMLEAQGLDNWEGYDIARYPDSGEDIDEAYKRITKEVKEMQK